MSNIDAARNQAAEWARQGKGFDPKQFKDDATRKEAQAIYNKTKK